MGQTLSIFRQFWFVKKPTFTDRDLPDQTGKVHIITGGYVGIGLVLARYLYAHNATLYLAGRSPSKAESAIATLKKEFPSSKGRLEFLSIDLSNLSTIKKAAQEFLAKETRLDVLVNNAGVAMPPADTKSAQGYEVQTATNVYGPFLFTKLLLPLLQETAATAATATVRVIWAASISMDLLAPKGGVEFEGKPGEELVKVQKSDTGYGQSKAANVLLAVEAARRWGPLGIISTSFNPGNLRSELARTAPISIKVTGALVAHPTYLGGYTELFAGWSPEITPEKNGCHVIPWGHVGTYNASLQRAVKRVEDGGDGGAERLWGICERVVGGYL